MEITKNADFDEVRIFELEMHSFLNVLSVLSGIIQLMEDETSRYDVISRPLQSIHDMAEAISNRNNALFNPPNLRQLKSKIVQAFDELRQADPEFCAGDMYAQLFQTLVDIGKVLDVRVNELEARQQAPDKWETFTIEEFKEDFRKFFYAMEKSSNGRYRIIYNVAEQDEKDYLVHFEVSSDLGDFVAMPYLLKDVIRDLIANARKYTPPGGDIKIGIAVRNKAFRFIVEDSGAGIPADEIEKVVDYGYRASNVRHAKKTMGGGFGLTKALHIVRKLGGRMWIDSEVNKGTRVEIRVDVPEAVYSDAKAAG
jgi:signal transduction histidine kinase